MQKEKHIKIIILTSLFIVILTSYGCKRENKNQDLVPEVGYNWPDKVRDYWPTTGWRTASMEDHNLDPNRMSLADEFAENDVLTRCLLVVKDGYIVFEKYYGDENQNSSTNLWSVTKSFTSALVGIAVDRGLINNVDQLMTIYLPEYPSFNNISIKHALTHTTGLNWTEEGSRWVGWILSDDWIAEALGRGQAHNPGEVFLYSSANSHFLAWVLYASTGITPGEFAQENLFAPLGIQFNRLTEIINYSGWDEYKVPLINSWRQDPKGIEIGGFCLYLTGRDMAKFGFLFLNKGKWDGQTIISESWVEESTRDHQTDIYGRYSYGYQWWITLLAGQPGFLASGLGGQIIGVVPSLDLVVVIKYEAENPQDPESGTAHDDMHLFELVVQAIRQ